MAIPSSVPISKIKAKSTSTRSITKPTILFSIEITAGLTSRRSDGPNFAVTTAFRLSGVDIYSNWTGTTGTLNRKYVLDYCGAAGVTCAASNTGRSVLGKVTPIGSDGITALPAVKLTSQNVPAGWTTASWAGYSSSLPPEDQCFPGDLNGDGKTDYWCQSGFGIWTASLSTGTGWSTQAWSGSAPAFPISNQCLTGDLNGDGKIDYWCESMSSSGSWEIGLSHGSGWTQRTWAGPAPAFPISNQCLTGDLNGDGKTDFWCETGHSTGAWDVSLSTGNSWTTLPQRTGPSPGLPVGNQCLTGDLNGDGKTDFWCETEGGSGSWKIAISTGTGWATPLPSWSGFCPQPAGGESVFDG
jgi:hypothetical protein